MWRARGSAGKSGRHSLLGGALLFDHPRLIFILFLLTKMYEICILIGSQYVLMDN